MFNPAVMVRTDAVRQVGGYRPGIMPGEDYDLWLRLGEAGKLANLPVPLLTWRRTTSGLTVRNQANQWRMNKRILDDAWARRGLDGEPTVPPVQLATAADLHQQWGWMALKNGLYQHCKEVCTPFTGGSALGLELLAIVVLRLEGKVVL